MMIRQKARIPFIGLTPRVKPSAIKHEPNISDDKDGAAGDARGAKTPPVEKALKRSGGAKRFFLSLLKLFIYAAVFVGIVLLIIMHYSNDKTTYGKSFYSISSDKLENPMRIVLLSDLHLSEFGKNNSKLVADIENLEPDLIAIVGDMNLESNPDYHVVTDLCSQLVPIAPVYYSFGNHETTQALKVGSTIKDDIEATGAVVIDSRIREIEVNGNAVALCGLGYLPKYYGGYGQKVFERFVKIEDKYKILMVHYPEYFMGKFDYEAIDLALCGHAHGGQVRLPRFGGLYATDQGLLPDLTEGVVSMPGGAQVVISRGMGDSSQLLPRLNNPYELVIVDLNWY